MTHPGRHGGRDRERHGFTLIEIVVSMAVLAIVAALAVPTMGRWAQNQRLAGSAGAVDDAISYARGEAVRTGNIQLLFVGQDTAGNALVDENGRTVDLLVVDDGRPGSANQNCQIDAGEASLGVTLERDVSFGVGIAGGPVPTDAGAASVTGGTTFLDAGGNAASWILFRPEGPPVRFSADCTTTALGTGGGGIYLTNGTRDKAVLVSPLGTTRIHSLGGSGESWTS